MNFIQIIYTKYILYKETFTQEECIHKLIKIN